MQMLKRKKKKEEEEADDVVHDNKGVKKPDDIDPRFCTPIPLISN